MMISARVTEPTDLRSFPTTTAGGARGIVPALLGPGEWDRSLPDWIPDPGSTVHAGCWCWMDSVGNHFQEHRHVARRSPPWRGAITTVAPQTATG